MLNIFANGLSAANASEWAEPTESLFARLKARFYAVKPASETDVIGAYIAEHGGVLTDQLERDISRRFGSMAGR